MYHFEFMSLDKLVGEAEGCVINKSEKDSDPIKINYK
jgi:hypothetical protein